MLYVKKTPGMPLVGTPLTPSYGQFRHFFDNLGTFLGGCKWDVNGPPPAPKSGSFW